MIQHFVLTLSGVAQNLLTAATTATAQSQAGATADRPLREVKLQPRGTNNAAVYIGDDAAISTTDYGLALGPGDGSDIAPAAVTFGPYETGPLKLSDFWVLGTANEVLHVTTVPF